MPTTHRVVCADFAQEVSSLAAAQGHLAGVERAGKCRKVHTIEVFTDGEWLPLHIALAHAILTASLRAVLDTPDGPLRKASGGWSKEACARADAVADITADLGAWHAAAGPHEHALLTADGRGVGHTWCRCESDADAGTWVRYERWTAQGRVAHGYACPDCRFITQAG